MRDPVEPGAKLQLGLARRHRPVGVQERLLDGVLRSLGREQSAAIAQQGAPVARDDGLERAVVASSREVDQTLVALGVE